jgi:hypothetical protein
VPKIVLSESVHDFAGACEHLLIMSKGLGLSKDERDIVEYYMGELPRLLMEPKTPI